MVVSTRLVKSNDPNPKKRFGQHFLRDKGVIDRIMRWIGPEPGDLFVEIGAGDGALSARLAPGVARLIAIEVDTDCIPLLKRNLETFESASVVQADILRLDLEQLVLPCLEKGRELRFAGNLPYNISTTIIEKVLRSGLPTKDMSFMVQQEVARRITAHPGSKEYGYFSVFCQHYADVRMGPAVSPACFVPRPQVNSAMVSFRPKSRPHDSELECGFELLGKAAFAYRRKTLENSLRRHPTIGQFSRSLLNRAGIDGARRAEQLSVQEYENLARVLHSDFRVSQ